MMVVPSAAVDDAQMYYYGGVELPALPEWDETLYPYAYIVHNSYGVSDHSDFVFIVRSNSIELPESGIFYFATDVLYECLGDSWSDGDLNTALDWAISGRVVWSNVDVYQRTSSGTRLYLSASDPIPVNPIPDSGGTDSSGNEVQSLSILSAILSAINTQNERQAAEFSALADLIGMLWTRLYNIEGYIAQIVENVIPSEEETAIREATKDSMQEVNNSLFADDAPTKVTASDVKDVAQIGAAASSMFDSGVSVGSFFDAFNDLRFIAFFSQETYDDLNTVPSVSTYSRGDQNGYVDYYSENLDKIQKFAGGG